MDHIDEIQHEFLMASRNQDLKTVCELLEKYKTYKLINCKQSNYFDRTALISTCESTTTKIGKTLLSHPDIQVNIADTDGNYTAFYRACRWGSRNMVDYMIEDGRVDINKTDKWGWTPLMIACFNSHLDIVVRILLSPRTFNLHQRSTKEFMIVYTFVKGVDAIQIAKIKSPKIYEILCQYEKDPEKEKIRLKNDKG